MRAKLQDFFRQETSSGILLMGITLLAMLWANSPAFPAYHAIFHFEIFGNGFLHWINDGLMVIFFYLVGIEIKKELFEGELSSRQKAALPILAALGGMIAPALIYFSMNTEGVGRPGWGIPMATDIAFAYGIVCLLGSRVPHALKIFLLALAIVDDLGAILVIAIFYTSKIYWICLLAAACFLLAIYLLHRRKTRAPWLYIALSLLVWFAFLKSGVHATIAGVLLGFLTPLREIPRIGKLLHNWVYFLILPIFALGNAGVHLGDGLDFNALIRSPITLGIFFGLLIGKPFGIFLFSWLGVKTGLAVLPKKVLWRSVFGVAILGGVGFTMALFIGHLALKVEEIEAFSKLGILSGSLFAAVIGYFWLRFVKPAV